MSEHAKQSEQNQNHHHAAPGAHDTLADNASGQLAEAKPWDEDVEEGNHDGNSGAGTPHDGDGDGGSPDDGGASKPPSPDGRSPGDNEDAR